MSWTFSLDFLLPQSNPFLKIVSEIRSTRMPSNQANGGLSGLPIASSFTIRDVLTIHEGFDIANCAVNAGIETPQGLSGRNHWAVHQLGPIDSGSTQGQSRALTFLYFH
jgi:hypothetical protein